MLDVAPTLMSATGGELDAEFAGIDLLLDLAADEVGDEGAADATAEDEDVLHVSDSWMGALCGYLSFSTTISS